MPVTMQHSAMPCHHKPLDGQSRLFVNRPCQLLSRTGFRAVWRVKFVLEYPGALYHVMNRGDRLLMGSVNTLKNPLRLANSRDCPAHGQTAWRGRVLSALKSELRALFVMANGHDSHAIGENSVEKVVGEPLQIRAA